MKMGKTNESNKIFSLLVFIMKYTNVFMINNSNGMDVILKLDMDKILL